MHNQIVSLQRYHGLQIEDEALFLASFIAQQLGVSKKPARTGPDQSGPGKTRTACT